MTTDYDPLTLPATCACKDKCAEFPCPSCPICTPTGVPNNLPSQPERVRLGSEIEIGELVRFLPSEIDQQRANFGNNRNPVGVLDPAREYTVERVEIHSWHTKLWLAEVGGPFNSVHFVSTESPA